MITILLILLPITIIVFHFKQQITGQTGSGGTENIEKRTTLQYLSTFWRSLEMPLTNFEVYLHLKWSKKCILVPATAVNQVPKFRTTDTKLYVPVLTLSTQDNVKLLKQLESCFKGTIN